MTKNNKKDRQSITKKKLAFEVAKLVEDYIEEIRVRVAFASIDSFPTFSPLGRDGPQ